MASSQALIVDSTGGSSVVALSGKPDGMIVATAADRVHIKRSAESWRARLEKVRTRRLFGMSFAASRGKLREASARLNVRRIGNLAGSPAP